MNTNSFTVRGPYTDGTFAVIQRVGERLISHGFYKTKGLADARLFQMRDERGGARR